MEMRKEMREKGEGRMKEWEQGEDIDEEDRRRRGWEKGDMNKLRKGGEYGKRRGNVEEEDTKTEMMGRRRGWKGEVGRGRRRG